MSTKVINGLSDKLAELLGKADYHQAGLVAIEEQKSHLLATLQLFNPNFDVAKVKPKRYVEPTTLAATQPAPSVRAKPEPAAAPEADAT